ncbi:ATP/GTP-binding protein [Kitasatospora sp. NPDC101447]|uniref:ATP/GTP-binding protein n=1 Tax=Kitasatospora sp. NPDC101447 TaxID=3364102 RepID=UPI0037F91480
MNSQTSDTSGLKSALHAAGKVLAWFANAGAWCQDNAGLLLVLLVPPTVAAGVVHQVLTRRALAQRTRFILTPTRRFAPSTEDIWRQSALLLRASRKGPWWAPAAARRVRVRLRADGTVPLEYSVEAPSEAVTLLKNSRFQEVTVAEAPPADDPYAAQAAQDRLDRKNKELQQQRKAEAKARKAEAKAAALAAKASGRSVDLKRKPGRGTAEEQGRLHAVRAEFVLRGKPSATLREVPLTPDPLQPLIDAVADIQTDLGELAEVVLDIQAVPRWHLRLRQWQTMREARERSRKNARRAARDAAADAAEAQDSLRYQLLSLLDPSQKAPSTMAPTVRPRTVDREETLGRLSNAIGLVRIQLLVRCVSEREGRAYQLLEQLSAALDVFGEDSRLGVDGGRILRWSWGANSRHRQGSFDRRWTTGLVAPRKQNWVHIGELAGLLKPPTADAVLPVLASELPTYELGARLVPHGLLVSADGRSRIVATPEEEFLFSLAVGKAGGGKTEMAIVRALALALAGAGVLFIDPHGDSWNTAAPVLAHNRLARRVRRIDLAKAELTGGVLPTWNPLTMEGGRSAGRVASAAVDSLANALSWTDAAHPRAIAILTKAVEALVSHNQRAVAAGRPRAQATVHQVRTLLSNRAWRNALLQHLTPEQRRWWETTFRKYKADELAPVLNPLDRLAANEITRAFLGSPTGWYDIRAAMDAGEIIWLCLEGTGPSDRLLVSMMLADLLRAGLSRRDLAADDRQPMHIFGDELISLDGVGGESMASITEQLRKFGGRLHVMTQLLGRVSATTRESIMQNSSVVSTSGGSVTAVRPVAEEWHGAVSAARIAELPRFHSYVQVTNAGNRVGPLLVKGLQVKEAFQELYSPGKVGALVTRANSAVRAQQLPALLKRATTQDDAVLAFTTPVAPAARGGTARVVAAEASAVKADDAEAVEPVSEPAAEQAAAGPVKSRRGRPTARILP